MPQEKNNKIESKSVTRRKVIFVEIDDEITQIYDRIKTVGVKHVYLVVPKRAIIFQSVVNLRILERKAEDSGKKISIITNDKNGIYLAQRIGMDVYNDVTTDGKPAIFSAESNDDKLKITPLKAVVNSVDDVAPTRLKEKKISITDILRKKNSKKKVLNVSKLSSSGKKSKKKQKDGSNLPKFKILAPNRHALISLVAFSVMMLIVILYISLPGVTIYLTPSASVLEKSVNVTLADYKKNRAELEITQNHEIASYPVSTTVTKEITHFATGKRFSNKGASASGKITIFNTTNTTWPLVTKTRFKNKDGLVFRIKSSITVPPATNNGPGTVDAYVVADVKDAYGEVIGERGNIPPDSFFLPGLRESSRSKIYAKSTEPMKGGITDFVTYVSSEDIEAVKSRLKDELLKVAKDSLREEVKRNSATLGIDGEFKLLDGGNAIKVGDVQIDIPPDVEDKEVEKFTAHGTVSVRGIYYNNNDMLSILTAELKKKKSPRKELLRINQDSTSYRIFEWDDNSGKVKLTATIRGIEQFSIDPKTENGSLLLQKIREHIAGMTIEDARDYVQNLPEINKAKVDSWPAWSPTVPKIIDNIKFKVLDAIVVS